MGRKRKKLASRVLPSDWRGLKMYTVHLGILGTIHDSTCIADIASRQCPEYELKNTDKIGDNG